MTGKYATRTTFTGTARFTIANSLPAPPPRASASRSGSAARIWTPPSLSTGGKPGNGKTAIPLSGSTSPAFCSRVKTKFLCAANCATPIHAGIPARGCSAPCSCGACRPRISCRTASTSPRGKGREMSGPSAARPRSACARARPCRKRWTLRSAGRKGSWPPAVFRRLSGSRWPRAPGAPGRNRRSIRPKPNSPSRPRACGTWANPTSTASKPLSAAPRPIRWKQSSAAAPSSSRPTRACCSTTATSICAASACTMISAASARPLSRTPLRASCACCSRWAPTRSVPAMSCPIRS